MTVRARYRWNLGRGRSLELGERTRIVGILNVTPDSFSDGSRYNNPEKAVAHALAMLDEGADMLDLGAESTRPGASLTLSTTDEQDRLAPVIKGVLRERPDTLLSVDTFRAETAKFAVDAGAVVVNDVSGMLWDSAMPRVLAELQCGVVLMHARGTPQTWATMPALLREEILPMVRDELAQRLVIAEENCIARERVVLDPGFGFGKRGDENFTLLAELAGLQALEHPLLIGLSRKGFLGPKLTAVERLPATIAANTAAVLAGAHLLRVHDVRAAREAAVIADALLSEQER